MDHVVGHLVRRGFEAHASYRANAISDGEPQPDKPEFEMPTWGAILIVATIIFFSVILGMVSESIRSEAVYQSSQTH
jgi:hypothetical protein